MIGNIKLQFPHLHPLFFYILTYICGIFFAHCGLMLTPLGSAFVIMFIYYLANDDRSERTIANLLIMAATFILGCILYISQINSYVQAIKSLQSECLISSFATITTINQVANSYNRYEIQIQLQDERYNNYYVMIKTNEKPTQLVDDEVYLHNVPFQIPKKDSFKTYAVKEQFLAAATQKHFNATVIYRPTISIARFIHTKRENLARAIKQKMSPTCFKYFSYLFLGNKKMTRHNELIREYCKYWGISHYLARSGLHLVLFAVSADLLFRFLPLPFIIKELSLLLIFIIYSLLSWSSISFLRSLLMLCSYKIARLCMQQANVLHVLCLTTAYVLLCNPIQLLFLDFQLSFGITFLLAVHNQIVFQKKQILENQSKS